MLPIIGKSWMKCTMQMKLEEARKAKVGEIDKNEQTEHTMNKDIITRFAP